MSVTMTVTTTTTITDSNTTQHNTTQHNTTQHNTTHVTTNKNNVCFVFEMGWENSYRCRWRLSFNINFAFFH